jgi:trk system potassium uptake protein
MGCGRVGTALAKRLIRLEHDVAIIDQDGNAFRRLGDTFPAKQVTGVGFDRDTLIEAGIEQAGAFAAVSSGDNSNILAARVARETFSVQKVVARIYDQKRAEVYERLGIPTVATVPWTADRLMRALVGETTAEVWLTRFGSGELPRASTMIQSGDVLHVLTTDDLAESLTQVAAAGPDGGTA